MYLCNSHHLVPCSHYPACNPEKISNFPLLLPLPFQRVLPAISPQMWKIEQRSPLVSHPVFQCNLLLLACNHQPVYNPKQISNFELLLPLPFRRACHVLSSSKLWKHPALVSHPVFLCNCQYQACNHQPVCNPKQISNFELLPPVPFQRVDHQATLSETAEIFGRAVGGDLDAEENYQVQFPPAGGYRYLLHSDNELRELREENLRLQEYIKMLRSQLKNQPGKEQIKNYAIKIICPIMKVPIVCYCLSNERKHINYRT